MREDYRGCCKTSNPELQNLWINACDSVERKYANIDAGAKRLGAKACHPNDGHVKRTDSGTPYKVHLAYPSYAKYPLNIGDTIALHSYCDITHSQVLKICEIKYYDGYYYGVDLNGTIHLIDAEGNVTDEKWKPTITDKLCNITKDCEFFILSLVGIALACLIMYMLGV